MHLKMLMIGLLFGLVCLAKPAGAESADKLAGIWQSAGYNLVLEVGDEDYTLYEITSVSAIPASQGRVASIEDDLGRFECAESGGSLTVFPKYSLAPIECKRLDRLPDVCTRPGELDDPISRFEILWHTFDENYAFFDLRGVDWSAEYKKWRPRIAADTSDAELFDVCAQMVSSLNDNHVMIDADGFDYSKYRRAPDFPLVRAWRKEFDERQPPMHFMKFIRGKYDEYRAASRNLLLHQLVGELSTAANGKVTWGILPDQIGYLSIEAMGGFAEAEEPQAQFAALADALDRAIAEMSEVRGLIVDVRFNGGGWDDAALLIASRFADRRRVAFSKKARAGDEFTTPHVVYVEPDGPRQFTRPVVLLASSMTASAAEIFVYCMTAMPHVSSAGLPTKGIHSDMLERHLPGGWTFYLSNEVYQSPSGDVLEKTGIPPAHRIEMFTADDFKDGQEQTIVRALGLFADP